MPISFLKKSLAVQVIRNMTTQSVRLRLVMFHRLNSVSLKMKTALFASAMNAVNSRVKKKGFRASLSVRPTQSHTWAYMRHSKIPFCDWGVVFHGKIIDESTFDFLIRNIESTRSVSDDLRIVVSTYNDEFFNRMLDLIPKHKIELIACRDVGELPAPNPKSLCQQIETIRSGLEFLEHENIKKSMKIRVDQSIDVGVTLALLDRLELAFPSGSPVDFHRIWTTSYNSYFKRPLGASDMFMGGYTVDLAEYWSRISVEEWLEFTENLTSNFSHADYQGFRIPETWLGARYLFNKGEDLSDPVFANYAFWSKYMGVINSSYLDHHWLKSYEWLGSNFHTLNWFSNLLNECHSEITFEDWLLAYQTVNGESV